MKSFADFAAENPDEDPLKVIQNYSDAAQVDLLNSGQYTPELVAGINEQLLNHAVKSGLDLGEDPAATFAKREDTSDLDTLSRYSDNPDAAEAAREVKALRNPQIKSQYAHDPAEYEKKLSDAELTLNDLAPAEVRNQARKKALLSGQVPFTTFTDPDGKEQVELSPNMAGLLAPKPAEAIPVVAPDPETLKYFKENPHVTGMAMGAGMNESDPKSPRTVMLNPYSGLDAKQQGYLVENERMRHVMDETDFNPAFKPTPEQTAFFKGEEYGKPENEKFLKRTLVARILTGDPSAGNVTPEQRKAAEQFATQYKAKMGSPDKGLSQAAQTDQALAQLFLANPDLDKSKIPLIRAKLQVPEGYNKAQFQMDRSQDYVGAFGKIVDADPTLKTDFAAAQDAVNQGQEKHLDPILDRMVAQVDSHGLAGEFSPEEQKDNIRDLLIAGRDPEYRGLMSKAFEATGLRGDVTKRETAEDPDSSIRTLSNGQVAIPFSAKLNKPQFDNILKSKLIPESQKPGLIAQRQAEVDAYAPDVFKTITARDPDFLKFFDEQKAAGKTNADILDKWTEDPDKHSTVMDYVKGGGRSVVDAAKVIGLTIPMLAGNDWARNQLLGDMQNDADRRRYAAIMGKPLGYGYDFVTQLAPIGAQIGLALATDGASAAALGADTGLKAGIKAAFSTALSAEAKSAMKSFGLNAAARSVARGLAEDAGATVAKGAGRAEVAKLAAAGDTQSVLKLIGQDFSHNIRWGASNTALGATVFEQTAGQAYPQIYTDLEKQTNANGTPKYTPDQIKDIALKHAAIQGLSVMAITSGFQFLGHGGAQQVINEGLTKAQAQGVFNRVRENWGKLAPAVREGLDMTSATNMLASVIQKSAKPLTMTLAHHAGYEAADETLGQIAQSIDDAYARGEKVNPGDVLRQTAYAALMGATMGAAIHGVREVNSALRGGKLDTTHDTIAQRSIFLETARQLDATSPKTAAAMRGLAINGPQESVPQGEAAARDVPAPSDAGVAKTENIAPTPANTPNTSQEATLADFSDPNMAYRVIRGDEAFQDIVDNGLVRTNSKVKTEGAENLSAKLAARPTLFPSFSKGKVSEAYANDDPNHYIIATEDPSIKPSTHGRHGRGTTFFPTGDDGKHLESLDASKVSVYKHVSDGNYQLVLDHGKVVNLSNGTDPSENNSANGAVVPNVHASVAGSGEVNTGGLDTAKDEEQAIAHAPVTLTTEPGTIGETDQMPEREGEKVTRWTASDGLGHAEGFTEPDGTTVISNIEAKARGTGFLNRVIEKIPGEAIHVPLQSDRMQKAMAKLVQSGVLVEPSDPKGVEKYPTRFKIAGRTGTANSKMAVSPETGEAAQQVSVSAPEAEVVLGNEQNPVVQTPDGPRRVSVSVKANGDGSASIKAIKLHDKKTGSYEEVRAPENHFPSMDAAEAYGHELVQKKFAKQGSSEGLKVGDPITFTSSVPGTHVPTQGTVAKIDPETGKITAAVGKTNYPNAKIVDAGIHVSEEPITNLGETSSKLVDKIPTEDIFHEPSVRSKKKLPTKEKWKKLADTVNSEAPEADLTEEAWDYAASFGIHTEGLAPEDLSALITDQAKSEKTVQALSAPKAGIVVVSGQDRIDAIENRLEREGVDMTQLANPSDSSGKWLIENEGWTPMPKDLVEAYAQRDSADKALYIESKEAFEKALKKTGLTSKEAQRVMKHYAISGEGDAADVYLATQYTQQKSQTSAKKQAEEIAYILADARGEMFDELRDVSEKTLRDAAKAVMAVKQFFNPKETQDQPATDTKAFSYKVKEELDAHNFDQGTAAFLQSVATTGPAHLRSVAKLLQKFPESEVTLVRMPGAKFAGAYVPSTGQVLVNTARNGPRGAVDTVLHELVHAATTESIRNPNPEQEKILKRLDRVRQAVAKRAAGNETLQYATRSLDEFATHFFTSTDFQDQVGAMTPKGEKNWFRVILDTIRELLGAKVKAQAEQVKSDVMNDLVRFTEAGLYGTPRMDQLNAMSPEGRAKLLPAYHGTPHKVGKFTLEKIGTGEGAQAFGHGLYFTEDENIANEYERKLRKQGPPEKYTDPVFGEMEIMGRDIPGNVYSVDLKPKESEYLDWDKHFDQQSSEVKDKIRQIDDQVPEWFKEEMLDRVNVESLTELNGREVYQALKHLASEEALPGDESDGGDPAKEASEYLNRMGIPGIRYLDGNSRAKGEGSSNYVIFHDDHIRITHENGVPVTDSDVKLLPSGEGKSRPVSVRDIAAGFTPDGAEVHLNYDQIEKDTEGLSPSNKEDYIAASVNKELAHQAGLEVLKDHTPEESERLNKFFQRSTSGNTQDSDIAFYRSNPTAMQRLTRYLGGALKSAWVRLQLRFDPRTAMMVDRLAREQAKAKDGYLLRSNTKAFDPNNPQETKVMLQPATEERENPEYKYTAFVDVNDGNKLYSSKPGDEVKPGWVRRMFARRDDLDPVKSVLKRDRVFNLNTMQGKFDRLNPAYAEAIKKENPNMDTLRQAIGSTAPLLTPDEESRINEEMKQRLEHASGVAEPRIAQARETRDKEIRKAKDEDSREAARLRFEVAQDAAKQMQARAYDEAMDWQRKEKNESMAARAAELRRVQGLAMQALQVNSPLTHKWAQEIRDTTNEFQTRLAEWYKDSKPDLSWTIDNSNGVYLARSYEFHQNPAYGEMVLHDPKFQELRDLVIPYFGKEMAKDEFETLKNNPAFKDVPDADLMKIAHDNVAEQAIHAFEDFVVSHEGGYQSTGTANNIKTEFQRFMKKNNLDPEITKILGEIEDPLFNASKTLTAVSGILFSQKMLTAIKNDGLRTGSIITEAQKDSNTKYRNWQPLVSADAHSQAYAPLAGYYASPEDKEAFDAAFNTSRHMAQDTAGKASDYVNRTILGAAGASLGVMTLGSVGYQTRNVVGGTLMAIAQGTNVFSKDGWKSIKATFDKAYGRDSADRAFIEDMTARGVLGDGTNISYLKDFLARYKANPVGALDWATEKGMEISPKAVEALKSGKAGWDHLVKFLGETAELTETWQAPAIYLHELNAMMKSGDYTEEGAKQEAARRTKMVIPSKSENSQAARAFGRNPISALIAPFLSFKTEMLRTVANTYILGFQDAKSENPVIKKHGIQRLTAAAAVHAGLTVSLPLILQSLAGLGDDEDRAIRAALPSYSKNSSFWVKRNKDGSLRTWDLTFSNPFSFVFDTLTQTIKAMRSGNFSAVPEIASRFATEEFLGENVVASSVLDVKRNLDESTGMPIWLDTDSFTDRLRKGTSHIIENSYTPAAVKKVMQAYDATNRPSKDDEPFFYTPAGILLGQAAPAKPRDFKMKDLSYRAFRNLSKANSQLWQVTNSLSSPAGMSEGEATSIYKNRVEAGVKVWKEAHELAVSYQKLGLTKPQILSIMTEAGLSKERSMQAIKGFMERPVIPNDKLQDIRKIDPRRHDEIVHAMRMTPRIIDVRD